MKQSSYNGARSPSKVSFLDQHQALSLEGDIPIPRSSSDTSEWSTFFGSHRGTGHYTNPQECTLHRSDGINSFNYLYIDEDGILGDSERKKTNFFKSKITSIKKIVNEIIGNGKIENSEIVSPKYVVQEAEEGLERGIIIQRFNERSDEDFHCQEKEKEISMEAPSPRFVLSNKTECYAFEENIAYMYDSSRGMFIGGGMELARETPKQHPPKHVTFSEEIIGGAGAGFGYSRHTGVAGDIVDPFDF